MIEPHPGTLPTSLSEFALYAQALRGDEKGESGILLENRVTRPQSPTNRQIEKVAEAVVALRRLRREIMTRHNWSLRELYRTLETPGANPFVQPKNPWIAPSAKPTTCPPPPTS